MINISMLSPRFSIRRLEEADAGEILALCRKNTLYYRYCGAEASIEQIQNDLKIAPPGIDASQKHYVGFFDHGVLAAVLDLIDGYPDPETCFIGFFMVDAGLQGKQVGSGIIQDVCSCLAYSGKTAVRLAMAKDNPQACHFWRKNGFLAIDEADLGGWTAVVAEKKLP